MNSPLSAMSIYKSQLSAFKTKAKLLSTSIAETLSIKELSAFKRNDYLAIAIGYKGYPDLIESCKFRSSSDAGQLLLIFSNESIRNSIAEVFSSKISDVSVSDVLLVCENLEKSELGSLVLSDTRKILEGSLVDKPVESTENVNSITLLDDRDINDDIASALMVAGEMVFHNRMDQFCQTKVDNMNPVQLQTGQACTRIHKSLWPAPFSKSFNNPEFTNLMRKVIVESKSLLYNCEPRDEVVKFLDGKSQNQADIACRVYAKSKVNLQTDEHSVYWIALVICSLARVISNAANNAFDKDDLSSPGIDWVILEGHFLLGEGDKFSDKLLKIDGMGVQVKKSVTDMIPKILAELSVNVPDLYFFGRDTQDE